MMRYTVKQAGGDEETSTNTNQNPPDATETMDKKSYLPGQRNPLKDAALGGGIGGLLGTALGYLYGHRGRWLAYDAIAGGAGGAGLGYMVGSSANKDVKDTKQRTEAATDNTNGYGFDVKAQRTTDKALRYARKEQEKTSKYLNDANDKGGILTLGDHVKGAWTGDFEKPDSLYARYNQLHVADLARDLHVSPETARTISRTMGPTKFLSLLSIPRLIRTLKGDAGPIGTNIDKLMDNSGLRFDEVQNRWVPKTKF